MPVPSGRAFLIDEPMQCRPTHPSTRLVVATHSTPVPVGLHEGVLHGVLGPTRVAAGDSEGAHERCELLPEQLLEPVVGHLGTPTITPYTLRPADRLGQPPERSR